MGKVKKVFLVSLIAVSLLITGCESTEDEHNIIYPGQSAVYDGWFISLDGGKWDGGDLIIKVTIINSTTTRRYFSTTLTRGYSLIAIDSTNKKVYPNDEILWFGEGILFYRNREFYPNESLSGELTYELSEYSGDTSIYILRQYVGGKEIFDVGSPDGMRRNTDG